MKNGCATLLCFAFALCNAAVIATLLSTPSGRRVDRSDLSSILSAHEHVNLQPQIYEVSRSGLLVGSGRTIDLHSAATDVEEVKASPALRVRSNGCTLIKTPKLKIFSGRDYSFAEHDGEILSVWGTGLNLVPVHTEKYPGVFVNTARQNDNEVDTPEFEAVADDATDEVLFPDSTNASISAGSRGTDCKDGITHYVEIGITYDNQLCRRYGNDPVKMNAVIQTLVNCANTAYAGRTCAKMVLVAIDGHCEDPEDPHRELDGKSDVLSKFRTVYSNKDWGEGVSPDVSMLVAGFKDSRRTVIGSAFVGSACGTFAFGWTEGLDPRLFAHEVGHTLNATHVGSGLMRSAITLTPLEISSQSARHITEFIDSNASECITKDAPTCASTCNKACVNDQCVEEQSMDCQKKTYGRGAGKSGTPTCNSDEDLRGLLCYPKCRAGYNGVGPVCWQQCPSGFRNDGVFCKQPSYGRGVGKALSLTCKSHEEKGGLLCYPKCRSGYNGVGPVCWQRCRSGYRNHGATCYKSVFRWYFKKSYGRGAGRAADNSCHSGYEKHIALCYPKCREGYRAEGLFCRKPCINGMRDMGISCTKDNYGRTAGRVPHYKCAPGLEKSGALCYEPCKAGCVGAGPVCWCLMA